MLNFICRYNTVYYFVLNETLMKKGFFCKIKDNFSLRMQI
jgi:hypothetical protein